MVRLAGLVALGAVLFAAAAEDDAVRSITAALRATRYQQALELAQTARRQWPKEVRILVLEGMALNGLGRGSEALARFGSALEISPDYVPALEAASEIEYKSEIESKSQIESQAQIESKKPGAAAIHLERLLALRPGEETAHAMLAVLAWKRGDCASAVKHFGQSQSAIAAQPDAQYGFGACLMKLKRPREALPVFERLLAAHPHDRDTRHARYAVALVLLDTRRTREAISALQPLVEAKDPDPTALQLSSEAHEAMGETPQAVALLREAIVRDPGNVKLYLDFASLSFAHQSFQVGIDMIDAGLRRVPDSAPLYLARGVLHVQLAEFDQADRDFDRAQRLDPKQAVGGVVRGLSQIQQNNMDQALVTVRTQLKDRPKDEFPYYVLAELLSRQGVQPGSAEFDEALHAALEAVRLKPDFTLARDVLSRLYLQAGETDRAIEQCRLALRDNPSDEMALYRLIRALQSKGGKNGAAEVPALLKQFTALRDEARRRDAEEGKYRLVEGK